MKRTFCTLAAAVLLIGAIICPAFAKDDDFAKTAMGKELINLGLKFLKDPGDFFFNLHTDNTDYTPMPGDRRVGARFNFFPTVFPLTWANLNMKVRVLDDTGYQPQVDIVGMYGDMLALRAIEGDVKPTFSDYSAGIVLSKHADEDTRVFGGVRYDSVNMDVTFSTPVVVGAFEMSKLNFQVADTVIFSGISHRTAPERYVIAQIGYALTHRKIVSRIMVSRKHYEYGLNIYPEGLFVVHPFIAWHWYF